MVVVTGVLEGGDAREVCREGPGYEGTMCTTFYRTTVDSSNFTLRAPYMLSHPVLRRVERYFMCPFKVLRWWAGMAHYVSEGFLRAFHGNLSGFARLSPQMALPLLKAETLGGVGVKAAQALC